jgi:hypothetical protein
VGIMSPCKCATFRITECIHCGFPKYNYNKCDYYQLACDYYISSKLTLVEVTQVFNIKYSRLFKTWTNYKKYHGYGNFKRQRKRRFV